MTAARHLSIAPSPAELLAADIREMCQQIDRRLGNRPGTAERGLWFWLWPPERPEPDVVARMHSDAAEFLGRVIAGQVVR